ncbi:2Fe-2S iron-sulfur cluster-binding protein [Acidithiobacillus caldus]|uniref:Flavohemoprotein n=6 Tax=Acidithiobacillus caldus TaxID=33059 RepID=A0A059ZVX5_ACICK|nr:2Fe-2S iron-sulfur cluster-binding protein [Acidithiobacillus caldus]AIA55155.1 flavohemoprotein [Acidithiobacillus caldus ATCC 51756]AIA55608.1 flavohemoprotein [Acidithiobacillus caldus ATCC 51756]AUW32807.2 2Fe-2S iron-sulfur cluster binding domain-containing protein [Acidithiobacillus caldus]MBU2728777.1 2Fe-2S iron-sulfur cluster binding domain-containing protein [Acidithiobacillus caldus]MBU2779175.1 2Fe-2S iron-sulfur cluster binding domain-containing protein [Acidithiobacillus caldu
MEHEVILEPSGHRLQVREDQCIVEAALEQGVAIHHGCGNGSCGDCKGRILSGEGVQLPFMPLLLTPEERVHKQAILCKLQPRSAMRIEAQVDGATELWTGTVISLQRLANTVMELRLRCDRPYPFRAGQYARIAVPGQAGQWRSYSMASLPDEGELVFHIRAVPNGAFSGWLFEQARVGDSLQLGPAQGEFMLQRDTERPLLLVAAGTGLAPIEAILRERRQRSWTAPVFLYFGTRRVEDLYHLDYLQELAISWPDLHLEVCCSDPAFSGFAGPRRLLPSVAERGPWSEHEVYLCGSPGMIEAAVDLLLSHGVSHEHIHFDSFAPSAG